MLLQGGQAIQAPMAALGKGVVLRPECVRPTSPVVLIRFAARKKPATGAGPDGSKTLTSYFTLRRLLAIPKAASPVSIRA